MKIRAVIDVQDRLAVRAIAGNRSQYQPLECDGQTISPVSLAKRIEDRFGIRDLYLADLDAIGGQVADWESIRQIAAQAGSLWFDTGISSFNQLEVVAAKLKSLPPATVVILGLESLPDANLLKAAVELVGPGQLCFSLDLRGGVPVSQFSPWSETSPVDIAAAAIELGVRKLILLDLMAVGTGAGCPTLRLCELVRCRSRVLLSAGENLEIVTGGGIRGRADIEQLKNAKVDQTLVATALEQVTLNSRE